MEKALFYLCDSIDSTEPHWLIAVGCQTRVNILESKLQGIKNVKLEASEEKVLKSYLDGLTLLDLKVRGFLVP
ncbi:hypothetical protein [Scytonema sp. PRP1]|uniref:hypothetical protein n=1 Tax=Scytonema sp. PRP1 TaxID=3120513 RepID=UPI00300C8572